MIDPGELHDLVDLLRPLVVDGVRGLDGAAVGEVALTARRLHELADRLEVHALGELDETGYTYDNHGMGAAAWFARHAQLPPAAGHTQVRVARMLRHHLHGTDQAWLAGTINRDHVRVLVDAANPRIRPQITAAEHDLIALADRCVFAIWRGGVAQVAASFDQDGPDPHDPTAATATWSRTGSFAELRARFAGADVEVLEQLINTKIDELGRRQAHDQDHTTDIPLLNRAQLRGHAIAELLLHGHTASTAPARAAVSLVLRPAAQDPTGFAALTHATWALTNPHGHHLVLDHFAALLCDCALHPLLVDTDDNPLRLGRTVRFATAKIRRAAMVLDGGLCVFPGCDRPATVFHHVEHFDNGGPTDLANIAGLCFHGHHHVTHRTGWTMHTNPDGWFWWQTPTGHTFWSQRHGHQRPGPAPPARTGPAPPQRVGTAHAA